MSTRATTLKGDGGLVIDAILEDQLEIESLFDAEEQWCLARLQLLRELRQWPVPSGLQSVFWNWSKKAVALDVSRVAPFGDVRLFGLRVEKSWQGLLYGSCEHHYSRINKGNLPLVYVNFVEIAPWNWRIRELARPPRFRGVGPQLVELAVFWSILLGYKGRVGLHSIRQAEDFYRGRCKMTDLGIDAEYDDFRYFEFTAEQAQLFLETNR